ncbi:hypothetical protein AMTR_s00039p00230430 [Amborella trichopoda]|uniref:Uncharacterized protein n=2 Tax=Amborella trichopoda TaxID=13333 RepID=U5CRT1_AMBTC|nr:hypothetical protein AMTR_s00039p00230430 [Amborella trichopoda]
MADPAIDQGVKPELLYMQSDRVNTDVWKGVIGRVQRTLQHLDSALAADDLGPNTLKHVMAAHWELTLQAVEEEAKQTGSGSDEQVHAAKEVAREEVSMPEAAEANKETPMLEPVGEVGEEPRFNLPPRRGPSTILRRSGKRPSRLDEGSSYGIPIA